MNNSPNQFPYKNSVDRLNNYAFYKQLFMGDHFDAFNMKVKSTDYSRDYARLRYIVNNFAGLISKVSADFLFGEPISIVLPSQDDGNEQNDADDDLGLKAPAKNPNHEWLEALIFENRLNTQFYESALTNSYKGDAIFKLRIGALHGKTSVIIEQVMPDYYFPDLDAQNVSAEPQRVEIAFCFTYGDKQYLRKEIHTPGLIENQAFEMKGTTIVKQVPLATAGLDLPDSEKTGVDRILLVHIPNWSDGTSHYGISDYQDLASLIYALNNRATLIDNILDKHADPILAVPEGVLDEQGNIDRGKLGVYEKDTSGEKPEYIVWDAKLDSSFKQIEELLNSLYMYSETSPSVFGNVGNTGARTESGRALKYRLMRTVAKIQRKQRYYNDGIKELIYLAQLLAKQFNVQAGGVSFTGDAEIPNIEWPDPIPTDSFEQAQEEEVRLASGNQSLKDAIKNIDGLDDEQAIEKIREIQAEKTALEPKVPALPGTAPNASKMTANGKTDPFGESITIPSTPKPSAPAA